MLPDKKIKERIFKEIESLPENEQLTILGMVENYIHSKANETEWDQLPQVWRKRIQESLKQADEGKFILHEEAVSYIRRKYGLNG